MALSALVTALHLRKNAIAELPHASAAMLQTEPGLLGDSLPLARNCRAGLVESRNLVLSNQRAKPFAIICEATPFG